MWFVLAPMGFERVAGATDLEGLVEAWTRTVDGRHGTDGVDAAAGVAIDADGNVVVVGALDGAADHGTDGYAVSYDPAGAVGWELALDAGPIGPDRSSSADRYAAIDIDPVSGGIALCGAVGADAIGDPTTRYLLDARLPDAFGGPPVTEWTLVYTDGSPATSDLQECTGADWTTGTVFATGWGAHGDDAGRWVTWKFDEADGQALIPPVTYDFDAYIAVPDQAFDVAVNAASGDFVVVGTRGYSGLPGSDLNDADWHVRYFTAAGVLVWEDTFAGDRQLDDRALAVTIDVLTGDVYVVGTTNEGTDNAGAADFDWLVIRYDNGGDGLGGANRLWTEPYESANGASEQATAVALDDVGDLLVGGTEIDDATGVSRWRVRKLSAYDGFEDQDWVGPAWAGDARVTAIDYGGSKVAIAGWIDDGGGPDFAATVLDVDLDEDGVADSVDACPDDPDKAADTGICGCNVPDVDTDGDGVENCLEDCPTDPGKTEPGVCGCEEPDDDTDGDGTFDCDDRCPDDPDKDVDVGICGCGAPDNDTDNDGIVGCKDACSNTPPGTEVNEFGCPLDDGTDTDTGAPPPTDGDDGKGGCGCDAAGAGTAGGAWIAALAIGCVTRRRRGSVR
ncbi:MAG: hypothetical protein ABMB14_11335 [Myxococcota bacterium]